MAIGGLAPSANLTSLVAIALGAYWLADKVRELRAEGDDDLTRAWLTHAGIMVIVTASLAVAFLVTPMAPLRALVPQGLPFGLLPRHVVAVLLMAIFAGLWWLINYTLSIWGARRLEGE